MSFPAATTSELVRSSEITRTRSRSALSGWTSRSRSTLASIMRWTIGATRAADALVIAMILISRMSGGILVSRVDNSCSSTAKLRVVVLTTSELVRSSGINLTWSSSRRVPAAIWASKSCASTEARRDAEAFSTG